MSLRSRPGFLRLGTHHRIFQLLHGGTASVEGFQNPGRRRGWINAHRLAGIVLQAIAEFALRAQGNLIAQVRAGGVGDLVGVDKEGGRAVLVQDGGGQRQGRARDIAAAHIEQPGNRGRGGDHGGVGAALLDGDADAFTLGGMFLAGKLDRMRDNRCLGRGGTVGPGLVDRVGVHRDKGHAGALGRGLEEVQCGR